MMTPRVVTALPKAMQCVGRRYVQFFNRRHERTGGLWEGRYRSAMLDDERYWLNCLRYVELNPVRAGLVDRPEGYRWSSYRTHALGVADALLTAHPLYLGLGGTPAERQHTWRGRCGGVESPEDLAETLRVLRGDRPSQYFPTLSRPVPGSDP